MIPHILFHELLPWILYMTTYSKSKWSYRHGSYLPEKEFDDMITEMEWEGENLAEKLKEFLSLSLMLERTQTPPKRKQLESCWAENEFGAKWQGTIWEGKSWSKRKLFWLKPKIETKQLGSRDNWAFFGPRESPSLHACYVLLYWFNIWCKWFVSTSVEQDSAPLVLKFCNFKNHCVTPVNLDSRLDLVKITHLFTVQNIS